MKKWFSNIIADLKLAEKVLILACFYLAIFSLGGIGHEYYLSLSEPVLVRGGDYVEGVVGRVHSLNPLYAYSTALDQEVSKLIFAGLVKYDPVSAEYVPDLVMKWEWEQGNNSYLFTLKPGLTWHNGKPLTIEDVIFTYETIQHPEYDGPLKDVFNDVVVEGVSENQVRFKLFSPNYFFLSALTVGIIPKHKLKGAVIGELERAGFSKSPIGSGSFAFVSLKTKRGYDEVILKPVVKNGEKGGAVDRLVIRGFDSFLELWRNRGKLDALRAVPAEHLDNINAADEGFVIKQLKLPRYGVLFFDTLSTGPTANAKVRLGIKYAINKRELADALSHVELMNFPIHELDSAAVSYDLGKAAALLFEAGWGIYPQKYSDGIRRNAKGEKLALTLATQDSPRYQKTVEILARQLREAGIELESRFLSQSTLYQEVIKKRDYQLLLFSQDVGENEDFHPFLHSSQIMDSGSNISQYKDIQVDITLNKIRAGQTKDERLAAVRDLQSTINREVPFIFLYRPYFLYLVKDDVGRTEFLDFLGSPVDRFYYFNEWSRRVVRRWR